MEDQDQDQVPHTEESNILPLPLASLGGNTEEGLEQLRTRLLDLTLRNRLLSFRHTKRSSLRIVDEVPDQISKGLVDGRTFSFIPVLEPGRNQLISY